jgi:hypothetical protein
VTIVRTKSGLNVIARCGFGIQQRVFDIGQILATEPGFFWTAEALFLSGENLWGDEAVHGAPQHVLSVIVLDYSIFVIYAIRFHPSSSCFQITQFVADGNPLCEIHQIVIDKGKRSSKPLAIASRSPTMNNHAEMSCIQSKASWPRGLPAYRTLNSD